MNDARPRPPGRGQPGAPYRVVFMGTPEFAVPSLERLVQTQTVVGVFTQPDRPAGRGRKLGASPVKSLALAHGIPVHQPASLRRDPAAAAALRALVPDLVVVAAYGLILPPSVLEAAPGGAINVHASLLPRWRGAAPVNHAILAGDTETGATIMLIDAGLDTGPILSQRALPLGPDATAGAVTTELAQLGAELLVDTLPRWLAGEITPRPQDGAAATLAPRLAREDGALDWRLPAEALERRVRAFDPWPGSFTIWEDALIKILAATPLPAGTNPAMGEGPVVGEDAAVAEGAASAIGPPGAAPEPADEGEAQDGQGLRPGTIVAAPGGPAVVTGAGLLRLDRVQPAGKRPMTGAAFARGRPDLIGARLGAAVRGLA